jgi:hypothetical protein
LYKKSSLRQQKGVGVEVYELFMFEEGEKRSARKAAVQEFTRGDSLQDIIS